LFIHIYEEDIMQLAREELEQAYKQMKTIREFEEHFIEKL